MLHKSQSALIRVPSLRRYLPVPVTDKPEIDSWCFSKRRVWLGILMVVLIALGGASAASAQAYFSGAVSLLGGNFSNPRGVAVDASGNVYVADTGNSLVKEIPRSCIEGTNNASCVKTLGGGWNSPSGVAVDATGNVFVADSASTTVFEIPLSCIQGANNAGCVKPLGGGFSSPTGVAVDAAGNVFVADSGTQVVDEIPASCIAGANNASCVKNLGTGYGSINNLAVDNSGNVFIADQSQTFIEELTSGCSSSYCQGLGGGLNQPSGVAVDTSGDVYVADTGNNAVKEIPESCIQNSNNASCVITLANGFSNPSDVAVDKTGNLYVADSLNNEVKEVQLHGVNFGSEPVGSTTATQTLDFTFTSNDLVQSVKVLTKGAANLDFTNTGFGTCAANGNSYGWKTGDICTVQVQFTPKRPGLRKGAVELVDTSGNVIATAYVYGTGSGPQIAFSPGTISAPVGGGTNFAASYNGPASGVQLSQPGDVAVDGSGNLYIADTSNNVIRKVNLSANTITTVAGNGTPGYSGDNISATSAELFDPSGVAVDGAGNLFIADSGNSRIREVNAITGVITTIAGNGTAGYTGDNGAATSAELNNPNEITVDGAGDLYIADASNNVIRKVDLATGIITTVAGNGTPGYSGDNGAATSAELDHPDGVTVDAAGNLYIADTYNNVIRKINASTGVITTIAGTGTGGYTGDGGQATSAELGSPAGVTIDAVGNLYIADYNDYVIRKVNTNTGIISTAAGTGIAGYSGNGGAATSAALNSPRGVAVDSAGNLYIADTTNNVIRKVDVANAPSLNFASTNVGSTSGPQSVTVENIGNSSLTFPIPTAAGAFNPSVSANFSYDNSSTCTQNGASASTAFTLAAGTSCTVAIDFAPTTNGGISGDAVLTDDSDNASAPSYTTQSISLSGTGINAVTQLAFGTAPPTTLTAGGNAGTVTVAEENSSSATVTTATDSITLTVTGPNSYSKTYTATAASGVASFNLSSVTLQSAGNYTYTATSSTYTQATATETVNAASASTISAVSGSGQSAVIGAAFTNPLVVKVVDSYGNPVSGATVVFTAPTSGASATLSTPATTGANGETSVTATANGTVSSTAYNVSGTVSGASTPASFTLTNEQASTTLTVAPSTTTLAYGQPVTINAAITPASAGGSVPTGSVTFYDGATTLSPNETVSSAAASYSVSVPAVGNHTYAATYLGDTNFKASVQTTASSAVVVSKASSTLAGPSSTTVTYGNSTSINVTVSGQYSGAGIAQPSGSIGYTIGGTSISGTSAITSGAATIPVPNTLAAGSYTVSVTYAGDSNYNAATAISVPLTVSKATATVTLGNLSQTYTGSPLSAKATTTPSGLSVSLTYNGSTTAPTAVGSYAVVATITNPNYTGSTTGTLVISQATPTITWPTPAAITYGTALSAAQMDATANYNGSAVSGAYVYSPAEGTVLGIGTHTLSVQFTPADSKDYAAPATVTTTITVNKASLLVMASNVTKVYGAANPTFSGTVTGAVNGDTFTESFSTTAIAGSNAGTYPIAPSVTGTDLNDYTVTTVDGLLTITKAATATSLSASASSIDPGQSVTLTATVTNASAGSSGTPVGTVNFYDGSTLLGTSTLSGGTASYTTSTLAPGVTHLLAASYSGSTNFAASTSSSPLSIPVAALGFTLNISGNQSQTVIPGAAASYNFQISPTYGVYPSSVSFSASGLPPGATVTFSPSTISANGGSKTVAITIKTQGPTTTAKNSNPFEKGGAPLALGFLLFPLLSIRRVRKTLLGRGMVMVLLFAAGLAGITSLTGCGAVNGFNTQAPHDYTITVTATSGGVQQSFNVDLNVQ